MGMKHALILYTIAKRVIDREPRPYPAWLVDHLREIEAQPSSEPMTANELLERLDATVASGTTRKSRLTAKKTVS
jgi:hypothetical protein